MANRTFKVYGQAYAETGDVTAVLTVGGVEVFNGALAHSDEDRDGGPPTISDLQFQFELDEATVGELSYSLEVTNGEFALGETEYNGVPTPIITPAWFTDNAPDSSNVSTAAQTHLATTIGETKLGSTLYDALVAGTLTAPTEEQLTAIATANTTTNFDTFKQANDARANALIDGEAIEGWTDDNDQSFWPIIEEGSTFTCTWNLDPSTNMTVE